ncbi:MAG: hypothetical protein LBT16_00720 [Treponema sp.]|jgi:hypothetical protein|nr:hypothetical protein [Treponema sp.]
MKSRAVTPFLIAVVFSLVFPCVLKAESIRVVIAGAALVSAESPGGVSIPLSYIDSALISLSPDVRFFRGVELEFTVPQAYMAYRGSLALAIYGDLNRIPEKGVADLNARQLNFEPVPNKIQSVYQIPIRRQHGLRSTPYVSVISTTVPPNAFPLIFRVMPVIKGLSEDFETMRFNLNVKPILSDEGAIRIGIKLPENLQDKPFTLLIDDQVIERPQEERLLREGEHHLLILSEDYRNENRVFMVERGKTLELNITLQDPTPLIIFEAPANARIFFDNVQIDPGKALMVEPGNHEVRFQLSDYAVVKPLSVQKGRTYRVAMAVDVLVIESD